VERYPIWWGARDTRKQRFLQGNEHPSFQLGQSRCIDELRRRSNSTGKVIKMEDGYLKRDSHKPKASKDHQILSCQWDHICWGGRDENTLFERKNHTRLRRKRTQACQEYEQMSYPVENLTILGRALQAFTVSLCHCECSLCLKTNYEKFDYLKQWYFFQLKHVKHLFNRNK
jgi:hypothetical protein